MAPAEEVGLVWFRRDLRLDDNPAWAAAIQQRRFVVPLYVIDRTLLSSVGPYRRRQLIANLQALDFDLFEATGGRLLVRFGDPTAVVPDVVARLGATAMFLNADVSPYALRRDDRVAEAIDVPVEAWQGSLVLPPGSVLTTKGALSKAFGAFHKTWAKTAWDEWPEPTGEPVVYDDPGEPLPFLDDQPPYFEGAKEARRRLDAALERVDAAAETDRTEVAAEAATQLSADLRYGTLSARAVVRALGDSSPARQQVVRSIARRDWYAHQLAATPGLVDEEQVVKYRNLPWRNEPAQISAWKGGFTGFPIVDAAMRELRETGRMAHQARVVAASFLVKDLLVDWRVGEKHFRHLLVDADPAQNAGNWQWVAGTGNDASPASRVIDPVEHSRRHDPRGAYIRHWVPELAPLDDDSIHAPWTADPETAAESGVELGRDYPHPIVEHAVARDAFLEAIKAGSARRATASTMSRPPSRPAAAEERSAPSEPPADAAGPPPSAVEATEDRDAGELDAPTPIGSPIDGHQARAATDATVDEHANPPAAAS